MKIAIINMGNNVINFKTVPSSETIYLFKVISEMGLNVDIISLKNGVYTKSFDEVDVNDYDRLIVVNSSINFFGGKPNLAILSAQKFMAKYKSKIYYLFTDLVCRLLLEKKKKQKKQCRRLQNQKHLTV